MDRIRSLGAVAPISAYEHMVREVADLALKEMQASKLPGRFGGPADAYRHRVGVGELTRRLGALSAYAISEYNELRSERAAHYANRAGRTVPPANMPDRHIEAYARGGETHRYGGHDMIVAPGGPIWVQPHLREGHPVRGCSRSRPNQ